VLPTLLVSVHDDHGVPLRALTFLVIPKHEDGTPLDEDLPTCRWLRELADAGACLCLHGMSHRMTDRPRNSWQWLWARGFARGQGELYLAMPQTAGPGSHRRARSSSGAA
jgi:predicted deacetylase